MAVFITPVEVTPGTAGAWVDVDCSAYIPAGTATGIIFHYENTAAGAREISWRKNGSTDDRSDVTQLDVDTNAHGWAAVGVDDSAIAEFWVESTSEVNIFLIGYHTGDAVFFTNAVDKSFATTGSFQTVDIASDTGANTAIAAYFDCTGGNNTDSTLAFRHPSSTDDINVRTYRHSQFLCQVDGSEQCEVKIGNADVDLWLMGYLTDGFTFATDKVDVSLSGTGAWTDLTTLPAGAIGAAIEIVTSDGAATYGLRVDGSSESIVRDTSSRRQFGLVEALSLVIEGQVSSTVVDFYRVGYFTEYSDASAARAAVHYARMRG